MARIQVPLALAPMVRRFAADFELVTSRWIAEGWHTEQEAQAWRNEARKIIQNGNDANSDISDMCRSWRDMAKKISGKE